MIPDYASLHPGYGAG